MTATIRNRGPSLSIIRYWQSGSGLKRKPKDAGLSRKRTLMGLIRFSHSKRITPSIK
jgi:hypothetical protein